MNKIQKYIISVSKMISSRIKFYSKIVNKRLPKDAKILVVGGSIIDADVFKSNGFKNVTISNISDQGNDNNFYPYKFKTLDLEFIDQPSDSYDYVVAHACLHHCRSPHRALIEMYRVATCGVLAFEARDSFISQILQKFGIIESYEVSSVKYNQGVRGGVNDTCIPNYVYRWNERDVLKTISSFDPIYPIKIYFDYGVGRPSKLDLDDYSFFKKILIYIAFKLYSFFTLIFKKQSNLFCFYIKKCNKITWPWLVKTDDGVKFFKSRN